MRAGRWLSGIATLVVVSAVALAGCSDDKGPHFSDAKIIDKLNLKKSGNGYAIDADPFCEVEGKLLNDSDEVSSAEDRDRLGLVITSGEGNVGVKGVPPFAPDCKDKAKKKLNKLDPKPKDDG
jgi:hypothetical protein